MVSQPMMIGRSTASKASTSAGSSTSTEALLVGPNWPTIEAMIASRCGPTTAIG